MKKYMIVGECMINFTQEDFSEEVIIELSNKRWGRVWAQRTFLAWGTTCARILKGDQCDQSSSE